MVFAVLRVSSRVVPATEAGPWLLLTPHSTQHERQPSHHHSELAVADLTVPVLVDGLDHLLYLRQVDLCGKILEDKLELVRGYTTFLVLAEHSETFLKIRLTFLPNFIFPVQPCTPSPSRSLNSSPAESCRTL